MLYLVFCNHELLLLLPLLLPMTITIAITTVAIATDIFVQSYCLLPYAAGSQLS